MRGHCSCRLASDDHHDQHDQLSSNFPTPGSTGPPSATAWLKKFSVSGGTFPIFSFHRWGPARPSFFFFFFSLPANLPAWQAGLPSIPPSLPCPALPCRARLACRAC